MKTKSLFIFLMLVAASGSLFAQNAQTPNNARMLSTPNSQTGTSYTFAAADTTRVTTFSNAGPISVNLPSAATAGFGPGTMLSVANIGAGTVTITCVSCTISANGATGTTLAIASGGGADIYGGIGNSAVNYVALPSPSGSGAGSFSSLTVSGTTTFTGLIQCTNFENVRCVDGPNSAGWAGTDIGGWINSAYAALPSSGGKIYVACQASGAVYNFTTPIVLAVANKPVSIEGLCQGNSTNVGGLVLNYTPTTATTAITLDYASVTGGRPQLDALKNISLINNNCTTTAGCGSSANGIAIGTTNGGAAKANFVNLSVEGFSIGFSIPAGASNVGWGLAFNRCNFNYNATGFNNQIGMENINFAQSVFLVNGTGMITKGEVYAYAVSFDGNTTTAVNLPNNGLSTPGPDFSCFGCHFENPGGSPNIPHYITGTGNFVLSGGVFLDDSVTVHTIDFMGQAQGAWFSIQDVMLNIAGGSTTITSIVTTGANTRGTVRFINSGGTIPVTFVGGASAANVVNTSFNQNTSNAPTPWTLEANLKGPIGIGDAQFAPLAGSMLHQFFDPATFDGLVQQNHGSATRTWRAGPGTGGAGWGLRQTAPNTQQAFLCQDASPFNCSFSVPITPAAAGGVNLGSTSLPFGNLCLGTAATNNICTTVAAQAAGRTLSVADPGVATPGLPLTIVSGTKALNTASITTATCDGGAAVAATGTLSTDAVDWSFNAAPTATNKYGAFLVVYAVPSTNTVTFYTCNPSATTSTPTAMTVNWSVRRP